MLSQSSGCACCSPGCQGASRAGGAPAARHGGPRWAACTTKLPPSDCGRHAYAPQVAENVLHRMMTSGGRLVTEVKPTVMACLARSPLYVNITLCYAERRIGDVIAARHRCTSTSRNVRLSDCGSLPAYRRCETHKPRRYRHQAPCYQCADLSAMKRHKIAASRGAAEARIARVMMFRTTGRPN